METISKAIELLENDLPSLALLKGYNYLVNKFIIKNNNNKYSIIARMPSTTFLRFCQSKNIDLPDSISILMTEVKSIIFDLDSLTTDNIKLYISKSNIRFNFLWNYVAENYPIVELDVDKVQRELQRKKDDYNLANNQQWLAEANEVDTQYPLLCTVDGNNTMKIVDGNHRAHKLINQQVKKIPVRLMPLQDFIDLRQSAVGDNYKIGTMFNNQIAEFIKNASPKIIAENSKFSPNFSMANLEMIGINFERSSNSIKSYNFIQIIDLDYSSQNKITGAIQYRFNNQYAMTDKSVIMTQGGSTYFNDTLNVSHRLKEHNYWIRSSKKNTTDCSFLEVEDSYGNS